tara:strand:+ start:9805 stop:9999 length:195 start_codon:yes stop_codon:yes gene_type:complete
MKKKNKKNIIIDQISNARKKNNYSWMKLLKLAMDVAPQKSKIILKQINNQDKKISKLVEKLSRK